MNSITQDMKYRYVGKDDERFFQYTMLDEASRERFIYAYKERSGYSTVDFVKRAMLYFGYTPQAIQTDNGTEFCYSKPPQAHSYIQFVLC